MAPSLSQLYSTVAVAAAAFFPSSLFLLLHLGHDSSLCTENMFTKWKIRSTTDTLYGSSLFWGKKSYFPFLLKALIRFPHRVLTSCSSKELNLSAVIWPDDLYFPFWNCCWLSFLQMYSFILSNKLQFIIVGGALLWAKSAPPMEMQRRQVALFLPCAARKDK